MLAANTGDPDAVNGHAGMRNLAEDTAASLKLTGRTTINLYLDDSLFTGSPTGPWADDIPPLGYAAAVHAIGVDVGRQREGTYAPRYADPATHALTTFADHLTELGITVTNTPSRRVLDRDGYAATIDDERVIASVQSATVGEIVDYFLKTSDNTITEVMGRLVAVERGLPGTFDGATTAVIQALTTMGLDTTESTSLTAPTRRHLHSHRKPHQRGHQHHGPSPRLPPSRARHGSRCLRRNPQRPVHQPQRQRTCPRQNWFLTRSDRTRRNSSHP